MGVESRRSDREAPFQVNELLPSLKLSSDLFGLETEAMELLQREHQQLAAQAEQGRGDLRRSVEVQRELEAAGSR